VVLEKAVGETPLMCAETWRQRAGVDTRIPLAYAGRLDPMASGKLLILIGDECKHQTDYHGLDKAYDFSVLLGIGSDTHDVLGRLAENSSEFIKMPPSKFSTKRAFLGALGSESQSTNTPRNTDIQGASLVHLPPEERTSRNGKGDTPQLSSVLIQQLERIAGELTGSIELPYPHFSAKTVQGKPLHMWTLEGRLDEIDVPRKRSVIYDLVVTGIETRSREDICSDARTKIDTIPPVTDERKALGNDFRRADVRADWERTKNDTTLPDSYSIAHFHCNASSGTYMRSLAYVIGHKLHVPALAWSIHRTDIGTYDPDTKTWSQSFK